MARFAHLFPLFAIITGLATLATLFFWPAISQQLLQGGALLAGFALLAGILNLNFVHLQRLRRDRRPLSLVLILSLWLMIFLAVSDAFGLTQNGVGLLFQYGQAPLEAAFAALLAFVLLFAGFRLLRERRTVWSLLFLLTAVFILIATLPFPPLQTTLIPFRDLLEATVLTAGVRGLLIGTALGTIIIAIRLLLGMDQPYNK